MPARALAQAAPASLRRHFLWLLLGVSGMLVGGVGLSLWFSLQVDSQNQQSLLQLHADSARGSLNRRLDYYRTLVDSIASDPALEDLIRFGDAAAQQQWAESRRRLIPDLFGLALLTPEGEVLGNAASLRVGPACRAELASRGPLRERKLHLHRETPGAEHVDLVSAVQGFDGEMLGGVFLSMRLAPLQRILDESTYHGHALTLIDAAGETVVSSGKVAGAAREIRLNVGTVGWTLVARAPIQKLAQSGKVQIVVGGLTLLAVLLLLGFGMLGLHRAMLRDVAATRAALTALTHGEPVPVIVPHYVEFAPAVGEINLIALQLQAQRELLEHLSLTDPLTSLPNRRAFETRFPQALGFAERGHHIALVLLDIDYFKRINDSHGHGVGDQVLLALAQTLTVLTRRTDLSARLAGDEFAILLTDLDAAGVALWYQRLIDHFS
ncbi:MAG: GGDEF domain-containing protein, partial [Thiobacillus sp.]|nr:GGDEF domain-containing protein [Thiobacillus sp.]